MSRRRFEPVVDGRVHDDQEHVDHMEYLLTLFASEQVAVRAVYLHRRRTGAVPPHLVEAALARSEELAREREAFRQRWYPDAHRVVVGGDRVLVETHHGRAVVTPSVAGCPAPATDGPRLRLVHSD